jgi:hypothetical protein
MCSAIGNPTRRLPDRGAFRPVIDVRWNLHPANARRDDRDFHDRAEHRRQCRAGHAHRRDRSKAEHEHEVEPEVENVRDDHRHDHRPRDVVRLQVRAHHEEHEERRQTRGPHEQERARMPRDLRRRTDEESPPPREQHQDQRA